MFSDHYDDEDDSKEKDKHDYRDCFGKMYEQYIKDADMIMIPNNSDLKKTFQLQYNNCMLEKKYGEKYLKDKLLNRWIRNVDTKIKEDRTNEFKEAINLRKHNDTRRSRKHMFKKQDDKNMIKPDIQNRFILHNDSPIIDRPSINRPSINVNKKQQHPLSHKQLPSLPHKQLPSLPKANQHFRRSKNKSKRTCENKYKNKSKRTCENKYKNKSKRTCKNKYKNKSKRR